MQENTGTPLTTLAPTASGGNGARTPKGEYKTTLLQILNTGPGTFNPDVDRLKFVFRIDEVLSIDEYPVEVDIDNEDAVEAFIDSLVGTEHWEWCNYKTGAKSDLSQWITWMTGKPIDGPIDVAALLDKPYRLTLGDLVKQKPDGSTVTKVGPIGIRPIKQRPAAARRPKPAEDDQDFLDADV